MQTRREFVVTGAAVFAGACANFGSGGDPIEPGLQLYTVRNLLEQDFAGTLERVAAIGYREVQVSPRAGHSGLEIRAMLDAAGLSCPAMHLDMTSSDEQEIEVAHALGARYVFLSLPVQLLRREGGKIVGLRDGLTLDTWREIADAQNERGRKFRDAGLVYGYHNHHFEFVPVDGVVPYDLILDRTDPELVTLEPDVGWMRVAGVDPVTYFDRYPGRFPVCHVKDVLEDGTFVDPGQGTVDFPRLFDSARRAGLVHYFVEHDTTTDPIATARAGYDYLSGLRAY